MPSIKSPLGEKSFDGQQREVLTIEDEGNYPEPMYGDQERQLPQRRRRPAAQPQQPQSILTNDQRHEYNISKKDIYSEQSRISSASKSRIEILLGIGRLTKEIEYGDVTFSLQSLKSREMREIFDSIKERKVNDLDINYEIRVQTLARSLFAIDGHRFEDFIESKDFKKKMIFIDELQERTVTFLHEKYSEMVKDNSEKFVVESKEDAEEVVDSIKK